MSKNLMAGNLLRDSSRYPIDVCWDFSTYSTLLDRSSAETTCPDFNSAEHLQGPQPVFRMNEWVSEYGNTLWTWQMHSNSWIKNSADEQFKSVGKEIGFALEDSDHTFFLNVNEGRLPGSVG